MVDQTLAQIEQEMRKVLVSKEVYARDLKEIKDDLERIETTLRRATAGIVALFFGIIAQLVVYLATLGVPG